MHISTRRAPTLRSSQRQKVTGLRTDTAAAKCFLVLGLGLIAAICIYLDVLRTQSPLHLRRDLTALDKDDDSCRLVHSAIDQCRHIKKHCATDEPGFSEYLDLYYCQLPNAKPVAFIILTAWLGILFSTIGIAASDFFCVDLSTMANILGMSESMAGVTLLAFGNGSPDVFSTFAAMSTNTGDLAVGELMGAACFITAVVAGSMAIIRPFKVSKKSFVRDVCFFAVAAVFAVVILSDGILHLWECLAMIGYYIFYVLFVLFWHWYEGRQKRRRDVESAARDHYTGAGDHIEPYTDDELGSDQPRPTTLRAPSNDDFEALERSATLATAGEEEEDYDDEERDRWMSELNTNMRLSKPATRSRSSTMAPIRPSLVGALEFQAVLKSFQKARNMQSLPLSSRRYSDDPNLRAYDVDQSDRTQRRASVNPDPLAVSVPELPRSVRLEHAAHGTSDPQLSDDAQGDEPHHTNARRGKHHVAFQAPTIEVSQHPPQDAEEPPLVPGTSTTRTMPRSSHSENLFLHRKLFSRLNSPTLSPKDPARRGPHILIPTPPRSRSATRSNPSPTSPFSAYRDDDAASPIDALSLPLPALDTESETLHLLHGPEDAMSSRQQNRRWKWWPYKILPSPESLADVLFPTLTDWKDKSIWAKSLAVIAAPSVFLLVVTLPVVETDSMDSEVDILPTQPAVLAQTDPSKPPDNAQASSAVSESRSKTYLQHPLPDDGVADSVTATDHELPHQSSHHHPASIAAPSGKSLGMSQAQQTPNMEYWPRWLMLIQLYTAPITVVFAVYLQSPETPPTSWLLRPLLISLLLSTITLVPVLLTTSPSYRPRQYRWMLSLVGFAVSIAWISTIANQVVGTLKALAIILNWSNAIMGLTIFAVGNSVSDLVADVTVANLGYPVMALSACFGGPMLNILLGIGLSGTYTILHSADRRRHKHPDKGFKIKNYHMDIGSTLIVSGISLLLTLLGVLVFVPLSKWTMTRRIGIALIVLWVVSTIANVVIEVTGIADINKTLI